MELLTRFLERVLIFAIGLIVLWVIAEDVFLPLDKRLPLGFAIAFTYFFAAYCVIPVAIRFTTFFLRHRRIPRFTLTGDGLHGDPVIIVLKGSQQDLQKAFEAAGWTEPDALSFRSSWKMVVTFLANKPYPTAPFSSLYLFGRKQDIGFQQSIGNSPRKRHHIRFWATSVDPQHDHSNAEYWTNKRSLDSSKEFFWVGAGTEETGFGFARLTYQVAHSAERDVDQEREYVSSSLLLAGAISNVEYFDPGKPVVGKFISDGRILTADLHPPQAHST